MTDHRLPSPSDDELLSAYLMGELTAADAAGFEARLSNDPALAAQLDALADALVALGGHDEVEPPQGFAQRLDDRLRAERGEGQVASLDAAREQRTRSRGWWTAIGTAAAVVAVGGVMATGALRGVAGSGGTSAEMATSDEAATLESADTVLEGSGEEHIADGDASAGASLEQAPAADRAARPTAPELFDDQAAVRSPAALRKRYAALPVATALLGLPLDEAETVAASFTTAVRRAEPFARGGAPGDCLDTVTTAAQQPLIPARIDTLRYAGRPALAYVLVTASPDAAELDRVEVWVVDAEDCSTLVFQSQ